MSLDPVEYFNENFYLTDQEELREMYESTPLSEGFVRFINGLEDFIFGVIGRLRVGEDEVEIHLIYAEFSREFTCMAVSIPTEDYTLANEVTGIFSARIVKLNPDKDFIGAFNTFQFHRKTALESMGYLTLDPSKAPQDGTLISTQKIIPVQMLDRIYILKDLYKDATDKPHLDPINKIYLMVDNTTGFIKIGKSKNPKYREGTLQSKQPETHLIVTWTAPATIEKELHKKFASKRKRGEWFHLSIPDHDEIKAFMDALE